MFNIFEKEHEQENTFNEETSSNDMLNRKLRTYFDGKIVRKDLTKSIKEGDRKSVV